MICCSLIMDSKIVTVLELIRLIRKRPSIWDARCPDFKNRSKKHEDLREIAVLTGLTTKIVQTKWNILKTQYSREKRRIAEKSASSASNQNYNKWYAFEEMDCLMSDSSVKWTYEYVKGSESSDESIPGTSPSQRSLSTPTPPPSVQLLSILQQPTMPIPPTLQAPTTTTLPAPLPPAKPTSPPLRRPSVPKLKPKRRPPSVPTSPLRSSSTPTLPSLQSQVSSDENTAFGLYVAAHLRKFNKRSQCKARYEINKVLYLLDMENLDGISADFSTSMDYQF